MTLFVSLITFIIFQCLQWDTIHAFSFSSTFLGQTRFTYRPNISFKNNSHLSLIMLRNFDLPEALIFYGLDSILNPCHSSTRPGLLRLVEEARQDNIPVIFLSERLSIEELKQKVESSEHIFLNLNEKNHIHYRSSKEEFVVLWDEQYEPYDPLYDPPTFQGKGVGHAPCPAALLDAIHTIKIQPKGFGGSSGFGVKHSESTRSPLPQHCVVFVSSSSDSVDGSKNINGIYDGSGSLSRDRCIASRLAGMRSIYIEDEHLSCSAEDVCDGVVQSYGTKEDWSMVTIDDISTPGSFWLNMAQAKDEQGFKVDSKSVIASMVEKRMGIMKSVDLSKTSELNTWMVDLPTDIDALLKDIDPL
jgi:hypothetical protein